MCPTPSRLGRPLVVLPVAVAVVVALAGCGRGGGGDAGDVANPGASTTVPTVVDPAACESYQPSPGVTPDAIRLGGSYPDSGPLANIGDGARGMSAYFAHLNEQGGIRGRHVEFVGLDDQYDPTRTVANVDELLQREQVFAIAAIQSQTGTTSVWDRLGAECVPMLFSTMAGATVEQRLAHLNVTDALVPWAVEGYSSGRFALDEWGARDVAFLGQAGVFGDSYLRGLQHSLDGSGATVAATQTFQVTDPTVTAQVTNLRASGADTLVVAASGTKCPQILDAVAAAGWSPNIVISWTCSTSTLMSLAQPAATDGVASSSVLRPIAPGDPRSDEYLDAVQRFGNGADPLSEGTALGWLQGELIARILTDAPALTRADVINTALAMQDVQAPSAAEGVGVTTSATDNTPFESLQMRTYDAAAGAWVPRGGVVDLDGVLAATEETP